MKIKFLLVIIISFTYTAKTQTDSIIKRFSIEHEVLATPIDYVFVHTFNNVENVYGIFLTGAVNYVLKSKRKFSYSTFIGYQYYSSFDGSYTQINPFPTFYSMHLIGKVYERPFFVNVGFSIKLKAANKKGFYCATAFGGGKYTLYGNGEIYDQRNAWSNTFDIGYYVPVKNFYFKAFVGLLSYFTYKEVLIYNNGPVLNQQ